jgi:hypothetical protein
MSKGKKHINEDIVLNTKAKEKQLDLKPKKKQTCKPNKVVNKIQHKITRL